VGLWLGLGIAIGGEWGYGQYVSWIRGIFYAGENAISIKPLIGYIWFFLLGIAWAGPAGIALGWILGEKSSLHKWLLRIVIPMGTALLCRLLIQAQPGWFLPNYSTDLYVSLPGTQLPPVQFFQSQLFMILAWCLGVILIYINWKYNTAPKKKKQSGYVFSIISVMYTAALLIWMGLWLFFPHDGLRLFGGELGKHLGRTVYTNSQNAIVVSWWLGALIVAIFQRDKPTIVLGTLIGAGFGVGMVQSALWCLGYGFAPQYIDWWKMWELNAGFNLGVLYVIALYWVWHQVAKSGHAEEESLAFSTTSEYTLKDAWLRPLASAFGVCLVWAYLFYEDGLWVSILLGPIYIISVLWTSWRANRHEGPELVRERQMSLSFLFCVFYFLIILFHGATHRLGVVLGLYDEKSIGQYEWIPERLWLFIPIAISIVAVTLYKVWRLSQGKLFPDISSKHINIVVGDMIMLIGFIGLLSIWPLKISVVYGVALFIAIFAYLRLFRRYEKWSHIPAK
jgi:hypothetical protein